jgi:hypothetical protein
VTAVNVTGALMLPVEDFHFRSTTSPTPPELCANATWVPSCENVTELKIVPPVLYAQ